MPGRGDCDGLPSKREVRFAEQEAIHQLVRRAVRQALSRNEPVAGESFVPREPESSVASEARGRAWFPAQAPAPSAGTGQASDQAIGSIPLSADQLTFVNEAAEPYVRVPSSEVVAFGQLHHTYLVVQVGGALTILDQHTAHERVLFERLYRAWGARGMASQPLLIPEAVELQAPHAALLQRYQGELEKLGLELEPFGKAAVLVRSVPLGVGAINDPAFLQDLLEDLSMWGQRSSPQAAVRPAPPY